MHTKARLELAAALLDATPGQSLQSIVSGLIRTQAQRWDIERLAREFNISERRAKAIQHGNRNYRLSTVAQLLNILTTP